MIIYIGNDRVREFFPTYAAVGCGKSCLDGENGVQKEHSLARPWGKVGGTAHHDSAIRADFLEDIFERRRSGYALGHAEAQSHCLPGAVIGILAQNNHLGILHGTQFEGLEDVATLGINGHAGCLGLVKGLHQLREIRLFEFGGQGLPPAVFDFYFHILSSNMMEHTNIRIKKFLSIFAEPKMKLMENRLKISYVCPEAYIIDVFSNSCIATSGNIGGGIPGSEDGDLLLNMVNN